MSDEYDSGYEDAKTIAFKEIDRLESKLKQVREELAAREKDIELLKRLDCRCCLERAENAEAECKAKLAECERRNR